MEIKFLQVDHLKVLNWKGPDRRILKHWTNCVIKKRFIVIMLVKGTKVMVMLLVMLMVTMAMRMKRKVVIMMIMMMVINRMWISLIGKGKLFVKYFLWVTVSTLARILCKNSNVHFLPPNYLRFPRKALWILCKMFAISWQHDRCPMSHVSTCSAEGKPWLGIF